MPYAEPESLGEDKAKSASFKEQANGREREQLETLLAVQYDDLTGKHRDGEHNPLERAQVSEEGGKVVSKMRKSSAEITIGLRGNGRTWKAPSCDATDYCCRRRFAR